MLVSTTRPKFSALRDLAKQLIVRHCSGGGFLKEAPGRHEDRESLYDDNERQYSGSQRRYDDRRSHYDDRPRYHSDRPRHYDDRPRYHSDRPKHYGVRPSRFGGERNFQGKWQMTDWDLKAKEYDSEKLVKCKKDFYTPHPNVLQRSQEEIRKFYSENEISTFGELESECPVPIFDFEELDLPSGTTNLIKKLNYSRPTPIQSMTWPIALSGYNMVGVAQTGSGKTLGFVLPGMVHLKNQPPMTNASGPLALIISPTRELVQQTEKVLNPFARSFGFNTAAVYGGSSKLVQFRNLRFAEACVGTPGRLLDFLKETSLNLSRCTYVVLDEADRLLDMGFEPQIKAIMSQTRPDSQILMWSATWPQDVKKLAAQFLKSYVGVKFGSSELTVNSNITQRIVVCNENEKLDLLIKLLNEFVEEGSKALIFCRTKSTVDFLRRMLRSKGFRAKITHSGLSQSSRDNALSAFRSGDVQFLIGTAVVARGLDVNDIKHVVNFDFPTQIEDYVHVVGRTGRCSNKGTAHTFFTRDDAGFAKDLIKVLRDSKQEICQELLELTDRGGSGRRFNYRY